MQSSTIESSSRVKEVFLGARDVPTRERADYLTAHCGEDVDLRVRVEALLAADANAGRFLASPTAGQSVPASSER